MLDSKVLIVILVLAVIVFGTKRIRSMGSDLGSAFGGFHKAMLENRPSDADLPPRHTEHL
jgi:sec-independent protein translocase protein TatA